MKRIRHFLSKAITFCKSYIELCVWLLAFAVGIRFFETILLIQKNHDFTSSIIWNLTGLCYDISLYLRISVWILIPFVAACLLSEKTARIILRILQSLMLLLSLICVVFFATSGFLLDRVVFTYSWAEVIAIIQSSSTSPVWVYVVVIVLPVLYFYLSGKRIKINNILLIAFVGLTLSSFFIFNKLPLQTDQYHVKVNKEHFFLKSVSEKIRVFKENDDEIIKAVEEFRAYFPQHQFVETEYPFLYKAECNDILSPFFNLNPDPPNFVFIIVEGLGYDFFKNDYQLMPFLDSLSKKSLSWEHCLSIASRTYGVLPALFGVLPLGEQGSMNQLSDNPDYHSLLRILHQNGYFNSFFYGGWVAFDQMVYFLDKNNMTYLQSSDWDEDITSQRIKTPFFSWGYDDHLTYWQALRKLDQMAPSPRVDIYLSLSTHDPWEYPRSSHFQDIVKDKVTRNKSLPKQQKDSVEIYGSYFNLMSVLGAFAYSDWSIQQLMEGYKKRDDFDNTIFIITGDHSAYAKQFEGYSNYHVPLIIYSPMLKTGRNMKGVVVHRDITPTILSLLQHNFNLELPDEVAWLNTSLDTSLTFNANTFSPLQLINRSTGGIMYKNYMLCEGIVEKFIDGGTRKIDDVDILQQMNQLFSLYQMLDLYILKNNALIKNPYAYVQLTNVVFGIEDTIAQNSYYAEKSNLAVVEESKEHNTTLYMDGTSAFPLNFFRFEIPDNVVEFKVDIEFMYFIKGTKNDHKTINIISDLEKDDKSAFYHRDYLIIDNQWHTYKNTIRYKKEIYAALGSGAALSAYIWNNEKLEGYIDDIKVTIATE